MGFQAFAALACGGQFRQGGAQIRLGGGIGGHFEQEARDRIIDSHQGAVAVAAISAARRGEAPNGSRIQRSLAGSVRPGMPGQKSGRDALRDGRQVARQRSRFFRFVSGDVSETVHLYVSIQFCGENAILEKEIKKSCGWRYAPASKHGEQVVFPDFRCYNFFMKETCSFRVEAVVLQQADWGEAWCGKSVLY